MVILPTNDGKYVVAHYMPVKKRFRTTLTHNFVPAEASSLDDLYGVRKYSSPESAARAIRKFKAKL